MDSDDLLHLSLHLQAPDLNITSDQQTEKPESLQLFYLTAGFTKDNAWHGPPWLHWVSHLLSFTQFSHLEIRITKVTSFLECFRPDRHKAPCSSCGLYLLSAIKTNQNIQLSVVVYPENTHVLSQVEVRWLSILFLRSALTCGPFRHIQDTKK